MPGDSLQYGLDMTLFMAVIDNPELMTSRIGREVRTGMPRNVVGQRILTSGEEESDLDSLGSFTGDVPVS